MGRPVKAAVPGVRNSLGLRVTAELKRKLDKAAALSGRSQSQEAEMRLEQSFRGDRLKEIDQLRVDVDGICDEMKEMSRALQQMTQVILDNLLETAAGEQKTGNATTSTCGSTGGGND